MGTTAEVTNLENGRKVEVRINDRGPHVGDRSIDLSRAAARKLDMEDDGTAEVRIVVPPAASPEPGDTSTKTDG
jgi:rare lipoprotein A